MKKIGLILIAMFIVIPFTGCGGAEEAEIDEVLDQVEAHDLSDKVLADLLEGDVSDVSMMCFMSYPVDTSELEVTTYIWNDKIRLEYMMIPPIQGQSDLYMVSDGEYAYVWGDSFLGGLMQGMKIYVGDVSSSSESSEMPEMVDFDMPLSDCTEWEPDASYFEIPTDIEFTDPDSMVEDMMEDMDMGSVSGLVDCSMCDSMPESEKASCLAALGCEE